MPTPARVHALRILRELERRRQTLGDLLALRDVEALPTRERGFLHELVLGTLRHRGLLDHALAPLLDRGLERLDPQVLQALRLGAYQLLRLRVPPHAAVAESVELVRREVPRAAALVNAVLRRLAREGAPPAPSAEADPLGWLITAGSLPRWVARRWLSRLGSAAAVARARSFLDPPPAVFRVNPRVADAWERIEAAQLRPQPLVVPGASEATGGRPADLAADGVIYLQDQGAQMAAHLAAVRGRVLDACAAPGGKATLLGDLLGSDGWIIAGEASVRRLTTLAPLIRRWGSSNVIAVGADARQPPFRHPFHAVLLDAPCSGLGTLSRHPDIRWRASPQELKRHAARQRDLLEGLAPLVRPDGKLVYSTCSLEPEENEEVLEAFLDTHPAFRLSDPPAWCAPFREGMVLRTLPERDKGDGFFAAILTRS